MPSAGTSAEQLRRGTRVHSSPAKPVDEGYDYSGAFGRKHQGDHQPPPLGQSKRVRGEHRDDTTDEESLGRKPSSPFASSSSSAPEPASSSSKSPSLLPGSQGLLPEGYFHVKADPPYDPHQLFADGHDGRTEPLWQPENLARHLIDIHASPVDFFLSFFDEPLLLNIVEWSKDFSAMGQTDGYELLNEKFDVDLLKTWLGLIFHMVHIVCCS